MGKSQTQRHSPSYQLVEALSSVRRSQPVSRVKISCQELSGESNQDSCQRSSFLESFFKKESKVSKQHIQRAEAESRRVDNIAEVWGLIQSNILVSKQAAN